MKSDPGIIYDKMGVDSREHPASHHTTGDPVVESVGMVSVVAMETAMAADAMEAKGVVTGMVTVAEVERVAVEGMEAKVEASDIRQDDTEIHTAMPMLAIHTADSQPCPILDS